MSKRARRYRRVELPRGFYVAWMGGGVRDVSRASIVGMGGLFLTTAEPPSAGSVIRLLFDIPGGEVRARAVVRDSQPGKGMGIEFMAMSFEARARLHRLLQRLIN